MAEEKIRPLNIRRPDTALSSDAAFNLAAQPILNGNGGPPSAHQKTVAQKAREGLTEQVATVILATQASHLIKKLDAYQVECINESFEFSRAMLLKKRNKEDQAHMEEVIHRRREFLLGTQVALLNATNNSMIGITQRSLEPDEKNGLEEEPTTIVIQPPGFFGRVFGEKPTVTEVKG